MADKNYLENVSADGFDKIVSQRRSIISAAPATFPEYDHPSNKLARSLHPGKLNVVVSEVKELNGAKRFTLAADKEKGTEKLPIFRAGQYISVSLNIGKSMITRPYSLCSAPSDAKDEGFGIVVKRMPNGFASNYILDKWKVGTKLEISAPDGFFYYEPLRDAAHIIGLAGGSGIAPFISMAKAIADGTENASLTLLYGSKKEEEILLKDELDAIASSCDKVKVVYVLSEEEKEGYENGFITAELIEKYAPNDDYSVFVCGSQGMYDFVKGEFAKLDKPMRRLRLDAYGEYKLSDKDSEAVKGKKFKLTVMTGKDKARTINASSEETILVALERAGIKAPSKCRSGECGFCRSRLTQGTVYTPAAVEKRRAYDAENGFIHPCCTYPTSDCTISLNYEKPERTRKVKNMKKKQRIMSLIMATIISAAMGAIAAFITIKTNPDATKATPANMMYISNIVMSVVVGIICSLILPLGKWGQALARKAGATPPSMKFTLLNCLPISIGNTIVVSLIVSFFGVFMARSKMPAEALATLPPLPIMWLGSWAKLLLPTLVASYIIAVILSPVVAEMVGMSSAGAEVGKAAAEDVSVKNDENK